MTTQYFAVILMSVILTEENILDCTNRKILHMANIYASYACLFSMCTFAPAYNIYQLSEKLILTALGIVGIS